MEKGFKVIMGLSLGANESFFYSENDIIHGASCIDTPQQNRRVKRKHRHILEVARPLLFQVSLPIKLWGMCVLTVVYLINRMLTVTLHKKNILVRFCLGWYFHISIFSYLVVCAKHLIILDKRISLALEVGSVYLRDTPIRGRVRNCTLLSKICYFTLEIYLFTRIFFHLPW